MSSAKDREEFLLEERARIDAELAELRSESEPATRLVPDFVMDVAGEYTGNAYPEQREYRITMAHDPTDGAQLLVTDSSGAPVMKPLMLDDGLIDGIISIAGIDHSLSGYEDDWTLPDGLDRQLSWTLQTDLDCDIRLTEVQIAEISDWLGYVNGEKTWNWATDGEVYEV